MKLKNRLIISFFIITIVPVVLFSALMLGLKGIVREATEEQIVSNEIIHSVKEYMDDSGKFDALVTNFCLAEFLILLVTAIIMVVWIYKGIAPQLKTLKLATDNIKEGNLDFSVASPGTDEMSELCNAFEDMRVLVRHIHDFYKRTHISARLIQLFHGSQTAYAITQAAMRNPRSLGCHHRLPS